MSSSKLTSMSSNIANLFSKMGDKAMESDANLIKMSRNLYGKLAAPLIVQMGITQKSTEPLQLLDNACGTGVIVQEAVAILTPEVLAKSTILCADSSESIVGLMKRRIDLEGWKNVEAQVLDAQNSGLPANSLSHVTVALGLHIIPNPDAVVKDAIRMLKPGGVFGATTFCKSNGEKFWTADVRRAFKSFPFEASLPDSIPMQLHQSGHWDDAAWVETHLQELGLRDVKVNAHTGTHHFANSDAFLEAFSLVLPSMTKSFWKPEIVAAHDIDEVKGLLKEYLDKTYGDDGWDVSWDIIYMTGTAE